MKIVEILMTHTKNVVIIGSSRRCAMAERARGRSQQSRNRKRALIKKRRQRDLMMKAIIFIIILAAVIGGAILIKKFAPSKEKVSLETYYGIENEQQLGVTVNNKMVGAKGILLDEVPYIEYSVVRDHMNSRFYLDTNENILLYTLPEGTIRVDVGSSEYELQKTKYTQAYPILKMEGHTAYIALEFVQQYTDLEFQLFKNPNRVMIQTDWDEHIVADVKKSTQVRTDAKAKSSILTDLDKKETVTILEKDGKWKKVCTEDGVIGYVKASHLKKEEAEIVSRDFEKPIYPNISKDYTINMAWHVVTNQTANNTVLETIANTKGLTTISPTWFSLSDTDGNINSLASSQYVNYAHQAGIEVWALVKDFDGGISSKEETYEVLSYTSKREKLINQLIAKALQYDIDGINVDFEYISEECGEHYIQFIRELSLKCRQNDIVISVDNYVPSERNAHYQLEEQGEFVDYVIIMGYDEHYKGGYTSGSVASYSFVERGIQDMISMVPEEKVINAIPFFTRLWKEVPKTEEELKAQEGTEAAEYGVTVTSEAYGMDAAKQRIAAAEAEIVVDEATKQNYAEWEEDGAVYKIWLEDETSVEMKLKLMKEHKLAGVAAWRLGFESSSIWDLILKYVN